MDNNDNNKLKDIVDTLPKINCGKCGYENCGKFAAAILKGEASPFGCRQDRAAGYRISQILGIPVSESEQQDSHGIAVSMQNSHHHVKIGHRSKHGGRIKQHGHQRGFLR
jgi:Na+-translocating ferredoxin:NAD+ oxidoreductase RNF subunit RnfB